MQLIPRLQQLVGALDLSGVRWCFLRPPALLGLAVGGDIDVLVVPASLERVREALIAERFIPLSIRDGDIHAVDYDPDSDRFLWLHIQSEYRVGGYSVGAQTVLDTLERDPLPRPGGDWLFWIVLLHDLVDKGEIPARHHDHLARLATTDGGGAMPLRTIAERHGLDPATVLPLAQQGRWLDLLSLPTKRSERAPLVGRLAALSRRVVQLRDRPGLTVAIIGPDGAGKTTLINSLCASLPVPTCAVYMGLTGGRLPRVDALRIPGMVLAGRLLLLWLRYGLGLYHRLTGRIVLFDRYPLDGMVPSGATVGRLARLSRRIQALAVPKPDVVLLLDASGAAMHARKGEYTPHQLEQWRVAYRRLERRVRSLQVIDADRPSDAVRKDVQARIWRFYAERCQQA
jgi:thymidylate kinase